jgi:hypothetical protein
MGHMPLSRNLAISTNPTNYGVLIAVSGTQIAIIESDRTTTVRLCTG